MVDRPHPLGVAPGQVVVDRDHVGALAGERVQVGGQRGHQGLALAGRHLRDLPGVEHHAAHQLDVEVAHVDGPARGLADRPRRPRAAGRPPRPPSASRWRSSVGAGAERVVGEGLQAGLERGDRGHRRAHALDVALVLGAEDRAEDQRSASGPHLTPPARHGRRPGSARVPQELAGVPARRLGDPLAAQHAGQLVHPGRRGQQRSRVVRVAPRATRFSTSRCWPA